MAQAVLRSGNPETIDYTPAADVAMGDVVVLSTVVANNTGLGLALGIAQRAVANAALGALAIRGGEWNCTSLHNVANYQTVFWDDTANKLSNTSTNNSLFGYVTNRQSASGDVTNAVVTAFLAPMRAT
jgi:phage-related tail protein